tara:strand:- start:3956 stop:5215 length:1260 start_codon:yes stop_codon:yes gene_type:complete
MLFGQFIFVHDFSQVVSASLFGVAFFLAVSAVSGRIFARPVIFFLLFLFLVIINAAAELLYYSDFDIAEYSTSLTLVLLLGLSVMFAGGVRQPSAASVLRGMWLLTTLGVLHSGLLFIQFVEWNFLGSTLTLNPFGPFAKFGPYGSYYGPVVWDSIYRPNGFFSEPSAAAWFTAICLASALVCQRVAGKRVGLTAFALVVGMLSTASLSGVVNALVILGVWVMINLPWRIKLGTGIMAFGSVFGAIVAVLVQTGRIEELFTPGTSLYVRIAMPAQLVLDIFKNYPFGLPLGQTSFIVQQSYFVRNEALAQSANLDNGLFVILVYFGLFGAAGLLWLAHRIWRSLRRRNPGVLVLVATTLAVSQSGAVWAPNYILLIIYTIFVVRYCDAWTMAQRSVATATTHSSAAVVVTRPAPPPNPV